ncbi:tetratricopeptide repeat protein [Patescibacteria group bacterium]|nr:tetratricopeptide repeat protein [Patescibacteria group bacterium]
MHNIEIQETKERSINLENIVVYIFYALIFLLPIFVLPLTINSFVFSKAMLAYAGIGLAFLFWLFTRLQKGNLIIPKSGLLLSLAGIILVCLASSFFSINAKFSLLGAGYEVGTFFFFMVLGIGAFLVSLFFQSEKKIINLYIALFISASVVFVFQVLHTIFEITPLFSQLFSFKTSNLIGGWNDFAIFFGLIALSSIIFFELFNIKKRIKIILLVLTALSFIAMIAVNFLVLWYVFGIFMLIFLVYFFSRRSFEEKPGFDAPETSFQGNKLINLSFFIVILVFVFILARGLLGDFTVSLGTNIIDARPSWTATYEVVKDSLSENTKNIILGTGPNTFLYDWLKFKPAVINSTLFWNTRFQSGIGHLPSMVATTGILGGVALLAFLGFLLYYGLKVLSYSKNDLSRALLVALYLGSLYLWTMSIFYSPGFLIYVLAFILTGALVALLIQAQKIKTIEISFLKNPKFGFLSILFIVFLILLTIFALYLMIQKYWAGYSYVQALNKLNIEGNLDEAEIKLAKAINLDSQDIYFRDLSEIGIIRIQQILSQQGVSDEILRNQFQNALGTAIQNAQMAVSLNPLDPLNWMQLARVYESVVSLQIAGAGDLAIQSYNEALKVSPLDPSPYLAMARVETQLGNIQKAREYIDASLGMKSDFTAALFFLAQIEAQQGNLGEAIKRTEQAVLLAPNDSGALFQLGLLYYQNKNYEGAKLVFERAIILNPNYSNARYFLGLIYDRQGINDEAIKQFEKIEELNPGNNEVENILKNLRAGRSALQDISPPEPLPEEREQPPIE